MQTFLMAIHLITCALLILIVLLQAGRGAGFAIFGGGGDTLFASPSGSSFLKQSTVVLACTFAVTSLMLTLLGTRVGMSSVTRKGPAIPLPTPQQQSAPAVPGQTPAAPAQPGTPAPAPAK
ncbi:MAG TPA: preprotein translocase subunit SecG [Elusimicrobia bacterium]|nr:preprotein translocase subunit SecG [Elusimicrobiota bacterium]